MNRIVCLLLTACSIAEQTPPETPAAREGSPFAGLLLVDQPSHAGYEASLYEFRDDGSIVLESTHVSLGGRYMPNDQEIGTVMAGGARCDFGDRYTVVSASRVSIDGVCSDGRARAIVLDATAVDDNGRFGVEIVSVGDEPGGEHPGFDWSFRRCASRSECLDFLEPVPVQESTCSDLEIHVLEIDGRISLSVHGTRYIARAVPVAASIGGRPVERLLIGSDGSLAGMLRTMPRSGELLVMGYVDGTEQRTCPIP